MWPALAQKAQQWRQRGEMTIDLSNPPTLHDLIGCKMQSFTTLQAFSGALALIPWWVPWQQAWLRAWQLRGRVPWLPSWLRQLLASLAPWLGQARQQASWLQAWGGEQGQLQGKGTGGSVFA